MLDLEPIRRGFSGKAAVYDAYGAGQPVIGWARGLARAAVERRLPPGAALLELNAGTGADAAYFAARGYRVHATDIAEGMLAELRAKRAALNGAFTVQACSFTELDQISGGPYDLVFSNFGGLNCLPDLRPVTRALPRLLKPGGWAVWVIMPPVCPWEHAQVLRGQWRTALRRWRPGGTRAHVAGAYFQTYYFTPAAVRAAFGPRFIFTGAQSLCLFCPPSYMDRFPHRFPRLTNWLMRLDEQLGTRPPLNTWGDFCVLTFQYQPGADA